MSKHSAPWRYVARFIIIVLVIFYAVMPSTTRADIILYNQNNINVIMNVDIVAGFFQTFNTNFGSGLTTPGDKVIKDVQWLEAFALPVITAEAKGRYGTVYSGIGGAFAMTRGTSDASGLTFGQPENASVEYAYLGWKSGNLFAIEDLIDVSWGRQGLTIGDGFLIQDGNFDAGNKAALYLGPRSSFMRAGIVRLNTDPVRFDAFVLAADSDFGGPRLAGANMEWVSEKYGKAGVYGFKIYDAEEQALDNLGVVSIRGRGRPLVETSLPGATLAFEYAWQTKSQVATGDKKVDARGWYIEAGYQFETMWSPHLFYRHARFSGDRPQTADTNEAFNPLFVMGNNYGTWFHGEITGQYLRTNSNQRINMVGLRAYPDRWGLHEIGALYYHFGYDQPGSISGVVDRHMGDEINLYANIDITDWFSLSPVVGILVPGKGGKQAYSSDDNYYLAQLLLNLSF